MLQADSEVLRGWIRNRWIQAVAKLLWSCCEALRLGGLGATSVSVVCVCVCVCVCVFVRQGGRQMAGLVFSLPVGFLLYPIGRFHSLHFLVSKLLLLSQTISYHFAMPKCSSPAGFEVPLLNSDCPKGAFVLLSQLHFFRFIIGFCL